MTDDIELVIKIPENNYNQIKSTDDFYLSAEEKFIKYGTPLPENHGRIIDESKITSFYYHIETSELQLKHTVIDGTNASTIIDGRYR